jgi:DNA repair exonuclease SbcCD ATPase subunit
MKRVKPAIVYPGSLIQQNFGEVYDGHGWCLWDVPTRTFEFVSLENDYGYITLEVIDGTVIHPPTAPKNARVRLFTGELEHTQIKKVVASLRSKYNIIELSVNKSRTTKAIDRTTVAGDHTTLDLTTVSTQHRLIKDWLERNYPTLGANVLTAIEKINIDLNGRIHLDDNSRNINWRPIKFTFSNMFSYGENNEIDFTDMHGVYGIFAPNAAGKSSIMDALMVCLYDKSPRAFKGDHIINNRKNSFECELLFEINEEVFGIKRVGTRKKGGEVKVDVHFWKIDLNGNQISLNGESRRDTNANIRSHVGTYEDFVMTALSGQTSNALFIDKSHSERKDLLLQFMGLDVFDKLFDAAHDENKEIAGILKRFKKSDVTDQVMEVHNKLVTELAVMESSEQEKVLCETRIHELTREYQTEHAKKKPIPSAMGSMEELQAELHRKEAALAREEENVSHAIHIQSSARDEVLQLTDRISNIDIDSLERVVSEWSSLHTALEKTKSEVDLLQTKIDEKGKFRDSLLTYKYNRECDVCIENNKSIIRDTEIVIGELASLEEIKNDKQASITNIMHALQPMYRAKEQYDAALLLQQQLRDATGRLAKADSLVSSTQLLREQIHMKLASIHENIATYKSHEENILYNREIDGVLENIQEKMAVDKKRLHSIEAALRNTHATVSVLQAKKTELRDKLKEVEELETTYEAFSHYMLAVGRDGVPYELMAKTIPAIETEINNILSQIALFTVSLEVDGKNINGKLNYNNDRIWPLENSSGMERFISSLAIRVALMNASNLPKPNFMIVDEGFGTLDAENVHSMQTLFNILKGHVDFIIIISHLDVMRDMVNTVIEIKKEDGYSQVSV